MSRSLSEAFQLREIGCVIEMLRPLRYGAAFIYACIIVLAAAMDYVDRNGVYELSDPRYLILANVCSFCAFN